MCKFKKVPDVCWQFDDMMAVNKLSCPHPNFKNNIPSSKMVACQDKEESPLFSGVCKRRVMIRGKESE